MPVKINELVIQIKVCEANKQIEHPESPSGWSTEEEKRVLLEECFVGLLEERESR